ncbi:hypothetical protein GE061_000108 [Apolygus lucorum]|uniref:MADF domain-containing protein n=1 Tax=Apolygus lucorum TaxID=248454 RepID=A0A8S9Y3N9_APOLU|nr:hypothetical protein GE061_000108 [Apolygus lucorum]
MSVRKRNQHIEEFIELYKSLTCLWKVKSKACHDRVVRDGAYEQLVNKMKEIEPEATKLSVVKEGSSDIFGPARAPTERGAPPNGSTRTDTARFFSLVYSGLHYALHVVYFAFFHVLRLFILLTPRSSTTFFGLDFSKCLRNFLICNQAISPSHFHKADPSGWGGEANRAYHRASQPERGGRQWAT